MTKIQLLRGVVVVIIIGAISAITYWQGSVNAHARESGYRLILATARLADARSAITKGDDALAVYHSGAATALSDSIIVALGAGEILIDAKQPELARIELARAKSLATAEDRGLRVAIEAQEKRLLANPAR